MLGSFHMSFFKMTIINIFMFTYILTSSSSGASAFIFNSPCPNTVQCSCGGWPGEVNCMSRDLATVPPFQTATANFNRLRLDNNNITYVGSLAFQAFQCGRNSFYLHLSNNSILQISDQAFIGMETCKLTIDISYNRLTSLPTALVSLKNIISLNVVGNPIFELNAYTMTSIGTSLTEFKVDIRHFSTWPTGIRHLAKLEKFDVSGIPFEQLDTDAFHSLDNLQELHISETKLKGLPFALCNLNHVTTLNISNNFHFNDSGYRMFDVCGPMNRSDSRTTRFYFNNNMVNTFPNIMSMFPSVEKIGIRENGMVVMNEDDLTHTPSLRSVSLSQNVFTRIPYALNKFDTLSYISLADNKISSIEEFDIAKLTNLVTLDLDMNPLEYITQNAFSQNNALTTLYMSRTHLRQIPLAVTLLPNLTYLTLNNGFIQCVCDMPYVKLWQFSQVYFRNATCFGSSILIEQFLIDYSTHC